MDSNLDRYSRIRTRANGLKLRIGRILLLGALSLGASPALAATYYVNSVGDLGDQTPGDGGCATGQFILVGAFFGPECTLRAAIEEANAFANPDVIAFALQLPKVAGVVEIHPTTPLPGIGTPIIFDGYSAAGYDLADPNADPVINLVGSLLGAYAIGLQFQDGSSGSSVQGLALHSFPGAAVHVAPQDPSDWIDDFEFEGNHVGISRGAFYLGNEASGLTLSRTRNARIGRICNLDGCSGRRNVISANASSGIQLFSSEAAKVEGNWIGVDLSGSSTFVPGAGATANGYDGIRIASGSGHRIGSDTHPESGNVISGNENYGINIAGDGHFVLGNRVGTNAAGTAALPNGLSGVRVDGDDNQVGTHTPYGGNLISGNEESGVVSIGGNQIVGNTVGLSADQLTPIGNVRVGIDASGSGALIEHNIVTMNGVVEHWPSIRLQGSGHEVYSNVVGTNEFGSFFEEGWAGIRVWGDNHVIGAAGRGNVVAFHSQGISILTGAHAPLVRGNWVGTDASGADLGNSIGVSVQSNFVEIGAFDGLATGEGNVIANNEYGIQFAVGVTGNVVLGNRIGSDTPVIDPADPQVGIYVLGTDNVIGGDLGMSAAEVAMAGNIIANHPAGGVQVAPSASGITMRGNRIYGHVDEPGIDLGNDGASSNDEGDVDLGANDLQNYPQFNLWSTGFNEITGELEVKYRVDSSVADSAYPLTIDFYLRTHDDAEADVYIGSDLYPAANAQADRSTSIEPLEESLPIAGMLVATATDADGNTSELSAQPVPVPEPGAHLSLVAGTLFIALAAARRRAGSSPPASAISMIEAPSCAAYVARSRSICLW